MDIDLAETILKLALDKGAGEAEVYVKRSRGLSVEVKDRKIESIEAATTVGYCVRVIRDNRVGFSFSTATDEMEMVVEMAIEASRFSEPDAHCGLPEKAAPAGVSVLDDAIVSLPESDAVEMVMLLEGAAFAEDRRIAKIRKATGSFGAGDTAIVNSRGISVGYSSTHCSAQIMAVAEEGGESQMGWDYEGSRFLREVSFERVGRNAARKAALLLGATKAEPARGSVILDSSVAYEFLSILAASLYAESVQKGKSMLGGKTGELVVSPLINVVDNGLIDGKTGSKPVDAEGVTVQNKELIVKGVLQRFLHNTYTARKDGVRSTGNAVRSGFTGLPTVGPTNLFIEPASSDYANPLDELFARVEKGIYIIETMGMHTANPISGEFSVGASGLWIEKGTVMRPVKEVAISGNLLDLFRSVRMVADDLRFYGSIGSPSLLIEGMDISG